MELEHYAEGSGRSSALRVSVDAVRAAVRDAREVTPAVVHRTVALSIARSSERTSQLRLERLARVLMTADAQITDPWQVWSSDWSQVQPQTAEALERVICRSWSSPATRNAMRDAVRAVFRESLNAGALTHDQARPLLNAMRPEKGIRDPGRQARGHVPAARVERVFRELADDRSLTARRDAALIALLVGAGLRREEAVSVMMDSLIDHQEQLVVHGKGDVIRDVPLSPGVRRAVREWLEHRGDEDGPLLTPVSRHVPRRAVRGRHLSVNTVARVVRLRFGSDVSPHDLRRTFTGDLLDAGADLSVVSQVLGHVNPATTARYDRRGYGARRSAVERMHLPFQEAEHQADKKYDPAHRA